MRSVDPHRHVASWQAFDGVAVSSMSAPQWWQMTLYTSRSLMWFLSSKLGLCSPFHPLRGWKNWRTDRKPVCQILFGAPGELANWMILKGVAVCSHLMI
jgi:hypothetical protein